MSDTTIPQPLTSGSDQAGGGSPASTNIPPAPDAQNDAVKQSIVDSYPNNAPNLGSVNPQMPTLAPQAAQAQPVLQHAPADNSPKASAHARLFDGILKTLSGGPVKVLQSDPTTGETREVEVPQSRTKMADSILAGVLSSLFQGSQGRGASPDFKPIMGANGTQHAEQQAAEQAKIDAMQDRKMKVVASNLNTITSQLASARNEHIAQQQQIDDGAQMVALSKEYDQNKGADEPLSIQQEGLNHDQALDAIQKSHMQYIAVPTGWISTMDANGKTVSSPSYSILDPHVRVKLTADDRAMLASTNPQWANAPDGAEVPLSVVNTERQTRATGHNVQSYLDQLAQDPETAKALGIKDGKAGNVMSAMQDRTLREAAHQTELQMASHNAKGETGYSILSAMLESPNGAILAQKLGIDPEKAQAWINQRHDQRLADEAIAKAAGQIEKKETPAADTPKSAADLKHTQLENRKLENDLNAQSSPSSDLTGAAYLQTLPKQEQQTVRGYGEGRLLLSALPRRDDRKAMVDKILQAYPDYDQSKGETWGKTRNEYMGAGNTAKKVVSYNTALEHMADLYDHSTWEGLMVPGSKDYSDRSVALGYVTNEVGSAIKTGVLTEGEGKEILNSLKGWTPTTAKERTAETARLLNDKVTEYQRKFQEAVPTQSIQAPVLLSPKAYASYDHVVNGTPLKGSSNLPAAAVSQLKEGQHTTFGNGQTWTLQNGTPTQVK